MRVCFAAIDICDAIYMLSNWADSKGAAAERAYALLKVEIFWGQIFPKSMV